MGLPVTSRHASHRPKAGLYFCLLDEEVKMIEARDVYAQLVALVVHSEQIRWGRLNVLLVISSIFATAWAVVFAGTQTFLFKKALPVLMCMPGVLLGPAFAYLGKRSSDYLDCYYDLAKQIEGTFQGLPKPFHASDSIRQTVRSGWMRGTSSRALVTRIPFLFAVFFLTLATVSLFV